MEQINDDMLNSLGLDGLTGKAREDFKAQLQDTLQERVGEQITSGMPTEKIDEFGCFMDGDVVAMKAWLDKNIPGYENDADFVAFKNNNAGASEADVLSSYGSLMWLSINRPDFAQIVNSVLEQIKSEIIANKDVILASAQ